MKVKADIRYGGIAGGGILGCDIKTEDGQIYCFEGFYAGLEVPHYGWNTKLEGDFTGMSHIQGRCAFEIVAAGVIDLPGGIQVTFFDTEGQIGTLVGMTGSIPVVAVFGIGGGAWTFVATGTQLPAS
jgi:hypothetical protein